jgi:hypothetical protein
LFDAVDEVLAPVVLEDKGAEVLVGKRGVVVFVKEFKVVLVFSGFVGEFDGFGGFGGLGGVEVVGYGYGNVKGGF